MWLTLFFWVQLLIIAIVTVCTKDTMIGVPIFAACFYAFGFIPSFLMFKGDFKTWIDEIVFCGVHKVSFTISRLSRKPEEWNVV